jgi:chemotaxis protein methyltransferase WspC
LTPDGVLFVGPSETSLLIDQGFESTRIPLAFAFRKGPASGGAIPSIAGQQAAPCAARAITPRRAPPPPRPPIRRAFSAAPALDAVAPQQQTNNIDEIRRLADLGRLDEAAQSCEAHLREHGASAEPLYLLGLIRDARNERSSAIAAYRKALYLEPDHRGVLEHMAALLKSEGDARGALVLGERLRRLERNS